MALDVFVKGTSWTCTEKVGISERGICQRLYQSCDVYRSDAIAELSMRKDDRDSELTDEISEEIKNLRKIYANSGRDSDYLTLAQKYAKIMGYAESNGKVYTDTTYTQLVEADTEAMLKAIATSNITVKVQLDASAIAQTLDGKSKEQKEVFDSLFSTEGAEITTEQLSKYWKNNQIDFDLIAQDMGFENLKEAAKKWDMDIRDVQDLLIKNFESAADRIAKQRQDLVKQMSKYSSADFNGYEINAGILSALELKFGELILEKKNEK